MTRDGLEHWRGCPRYLVHTRRHDDGTRTRCCFTCGAVARLDGNGRVVSTFTPDQPPMWARIPEEIR